MEIIILINSVNMALNKIQRNDLSRLKVTVVDNNKEK